jgi:malonyl-CoA decarboxylase
MYMVLEDTVYPSDKSFSAFSRRTMKEIARAWNGFMSMARLAFTGKVSPDLTKSDENHLKKEISECVFARGGEISSRSRAVELGMVYMNLSQEGRMNFLRILANDFDIDRKGLKKQTETLDKLEDKDKTIDAEIALAETLVPPRIKLLKQFNALPNGFKFLIDMRADVLPRTKKDPALRKLALDLQGLLASWFDVGLLDLREITWNASAALLEKLIEYEAVHEIQSWDDLKNRLDSDRRCFAFFHNKMQHEPLIFVEVALVNEMSASIQKLLDQDAEKINPDEADTAIFYSISATQPGLTGINLGNFLIKRVVEKISNDLKNIKNFATLSPLPRFRKWLAPKISAGDTSILTPAEVEKLKKIVKDENEARGMYQLLEAGWQDKPEAEEIIKPIVMRLGAHYLLQEKRREKALDPVANFHLSNGARLERLNWMADASENGLKTAYGLMANYHYKLSEIEENHEHYITEGKINGSKEVRGWLKSGS